MNPKRFALLVSFLAYWTAPVWAECPYFRTNYKLVKCAEWKDTDPAEVTEDIPEDVAPIVGRAVKITCSCDYSLAGSDPRCDFDQNLEQSGIRASEKPAATCARGKELCRDVCAQRLP